MALADDIEIWKPVQGYEGLYEISSHGRLKSLARIINPGRKRSRFKPEKILKWCNSQGYLATYLSVDNGKKFVRAHVLMMQAFTPNPENKPEVNHKNGIRNDNRLDNLEWCTHSENIQHSYQVLKRVSQKGVNNGNCKLTEVDVLNIFQKRREGGSFRGIAKVFNVSKTHIQHIIHGKLWKNLETQTRWL